MFDNIAYPQPIATSSEICNQNARGTHPAFPWLRNKRDTHASAHDFPIGLPGNQEVLQVTPLSVNEVGFGFVPLHAPLKPGGDERVVPGAIVPLYDAFVTVTFAPLCV